ncbi:MAG: NDP-sugar synthase [Deltaproteobacteria bacterium]|nr:NDP-sugar synthase [Deltaproteobacteria bacterium]
MNAMVLAAGLGTRARPLSLVRPKCLFPVLNRPLIDHAVEKLVNAGVKAIVVNTFHLGRLVEKFLAAGNYPLSIEISREKQLLGTGGGLKNAARLLGPDPFLVYNADIMTNLDLKTIAEEHKTDGRLATLVLHDYPPLSRVDLDSQDRVVGLRDYRLPKATPTRRLAFTGIHVIDPQVLTWIADGPGDIIDTYLTLLRAGGTIKAYVAENPQWWDSGTLESYLALHDALLSAKTCQVISAAGARIAPGAVIEGWACLGENALLEPGAVVVKSVLWPGARIASGVTIDNCVVADGVIVRENSRGLALV